MSDPIVYLLTDGREEEISPFVEKACRLSGFACALRTFKPVSDAESLDKVLSQIKEEKHAVLLIHAFEESDLREQVHTFTIKEGIPSYDLIYPLLALLMRAGKAEMTNAIPLVPQERDPSSLDHLLAYDFARRFDDGQDPRGIHYADLVLIGISRTMKTPLTLYLASQKFRVVNVPLLPEVSPPEELFRISPNKVIGLTARPDQLLTLRQERLKSLGLPADSAYASLERIEEELDYAQRIMEKIGCPVLDVTDRAVEETAEIIMSLREEMGNLG